MPIINNANVATCKVLYFSHPVTIIITNRNKTALKMDINKIIEENLLKISVSGEMDASSAIEMDEVMKDVLENGNYNILINCKELKYISSAGLGVFVSYLEDFKAHSRKFIFYDMSESVFNVFQILGLDNIMLIAKDEESAKKEINES